MSKQYTVYTNGKHHVVEGDKHKITTDDKEGYDKTLTVFNDGEAVFQTYGYFSFVVSAGAPFVTEGFD